ncbi:MAG: GNAT family N-acetyltransferase [Chloroflexi bacterium]|nr:GNAT family N-acetyltransferase [Chloroflexota bacterium]
MIIRTAVNKDLHPLSKLAKETYTAAFAYSFLPADLAAHLENNLSPSNFAQILLNQTILVAEEENRMVGFVQIGKANGFAEADPDKDWAINKMYVHADFQNRGVGSLLMDSALEQLRRAGITRIFLDVWEHNLGAIRFYQRYGFELIGERCFEVDSGAETSLDLIMMRRQSV